MHLSSLDQSRLAQSQRIWQAAKKVLLFDDPDRTMNQLSKLKLRIAEDELGAVSPSPADLWFSQWFSVQNAKRFTDNSFLVWVTENPPSASADPKIARYCEEAGLSERAADWCSSFAATAVPWSALARKNAADEVARTMVALFEVLDDVAADMNDAWSRFSRALSSRRGQLVTEFLPNALLLVEGTTEVLLLPHFAKVASSPFNDLAVLIIPGGGAKQVAKRFIHMREFVDLPLFCILDADAVEQAELITENLRPMDELFVLSNGEIEDTIDNDVFVEMLNCYLQHSLASSPLITLNEFDRHANGSNTETAKKLLRQKASLDFDKVEFARVVCDHLHDGKMVPEELSQIIARIVNRVQESSERTNG